MVGQLQAVTKQSVKGPKSQKLGEVLCLEVITLKPCLGFRPADPALQILHALASAIARAYS